MNVRTMLTNAFDRNVSSVDRIIRALLALSVPILYLTGQIAGIAAIILAVLAVLIVRTSVTGTCGIYYGLGRSTYRKTPQQPPSGQSERGQV
jgi:Na+(H+)/acetate symporter ActP